MVLRARGARQVSHAVILGGVGHGGGRGLDRRQVWPGEGGWGRPHVTTLGVRTYTFTSRMEPKGSRDEGRMADGDRGTHWGRTGPACRWTQRLAIAAVRAGGSALLPGSQGSREGQRLEVRAFPRGRSTRRQPGPGAQDPPGGAATAPPRRPTDRQPLSPPHLPHSEGPHLPRQPT